MSTDSPKKSNTLIWGIVFIVGAIMLIWSMSISRTGQVWVTPEHHAFTDSGEVNDNKDAVWEEVDAANATSADISWTTYEVVPDSELTTAMIESGDATLSWSRTIGLWLSAIFTLFILSFLVGDNPAYKFAEAMVVGTSAGYFLVIGIWDVFVPNLLAKLFPALVQSWSLPGMDASAPSQWLYIVPAILIVMLLWQLMPSGGWISRWPIAFFIGITAGYRMIGYVEADLVAQIKAGIVPLWITGEGGFEFWPTFNACLLTIATLSAMIYFFFSIEHKGFVGRTARVGIWFLMITFGATFGYTVMGRIALLAQRLEFLFGDWLHFIPSS
ncbi:MAG: hypothetical protein QGI78_03190 [Phycisphaerales bacterium]|nr:hypothetical protein [Phycisphaerales bacterium]